MAQVANENKVIRVVNIIHVNLTLFYFVIPRNLLLKIGTELSNINSMPQL